MVLSSLVECLFGQGAFKEVCGWVGSGRAALPQRERESRAEKPPVCQPLPWVLGEMARFYGFRREQGILRK